MMGHVVKDGARNCRSELGGRGFKSLRLKRSKMPVKPKIVDHVGAYGCNMSIRMKFNRQVALR